MWRARFRNRYIIGLGVAAAVVAFIVGGWLIWSVFKPPPDGFAITLGAAQPLSGGEARVFQYTIDARDPTAWAYFDFSANAQVQATTESLDWDIAFRRTDVLTNGGVTNAAGQGAAADLGRMPIAETISPTSEYVVDVRHEERGIENPALHTWYSYNWVTHVISTKEHTYAVRTASGDTVILSFVSYYCDDGSAACITFQYKAFERGLEQ